MLGICKHCGSDMSPKQDREKGGCWHQARNLCNRCYVQAHIRAQYPRVRRSVDETMRIYDSLFAKGMARPEIAARLGIQDHSLYKILRTRRPDHIRRRGEGT